MMSRMGKLVAISLIFFFTQPVVAVEIITVKSEFLELHTGAGRGYPVVNVVEQGEVFTLLKRKHYWLKVQTAYGDQGWISYDDFLSASLLKRSNHRKRVARSQWQFGARSGLLSSDPFYSGYLNFYIKPQIGAGIEAGQMAGVFSSSAFYSANLRLVFFRESLLSPAFDLGFGFLNYSPRESLLNGNGHKYNLFKIGFGVLYNPYKRLALELLVHNVSVTNFDNYWGGSLSASVFYD